MWTCLEVVLQGDSDLFVRTPAVQFCSVRIPNRNQQLWPDPAETARPLPNRQELAGATRTSGDTSTPEVLCCVSLREVKISDYSDQWSMARLAAQAPRHCPLSPIYLSKHHGPSLGSASTKHHVSLYHMTQPELTLEPSLNSWHWLCVVLMCLLCQLYSSMNGSWLYYFCRFSPHRNTCFIGLRVYFALLPG